MKAEEARELMKSYISKVIEEINEKIRQEAIEMKSELYLTSEDDYRGVEIGVLAEYYKERGFKVDFCTCALGYIISWGGV